MTLAPHNNRIQLPARFEDPELADLYQSSFTAMVEGFRSNPALGVLHHMMAERLVYMYVKSIEAGRIVPDINGVISETARERAFNMERSWNEQFTKLTSELGKETRVQSREGVFKQALIAAVILVLREELDSYPQVADRIMQRLEGL